MFLDSLRELKKARSLTLCGVLIAIYVVLNTLAIFVTPSIKLTFSYVALAAIAMLFGPTVAFFAGGIGDVLGYFLRANPGALHPGLTLSVMLSGLIYGIFLYRRDLTLWRIILAKALVNLCINIFLNTYWLSNLYGDAYLVLLPERVVKNLALLPIEVALIFLVLKTVTLVNHRRTT